MAENGAPREDEGHVTEVAAPLPLAVVGCDFRTASSRRRSRLVTGEEEALHIARELERSEAADGFVDLNTCNRNEWVVSSTQPVWAAELLRCWMLERLEGLDGPPVHPYVYTGEAAARHLFRVVMGQESLVVGERQIAGQLYRALDTARQRGTSSRILNGLGTISGRVVRRADRSGCLAHANRGVHSMALRYLRQRLAGRAEARVAVVGLGEIGRRVRGLLEAETSFHVIPCNRTVRPGEQGSVRPFTELAAVLAEADAAVICTNASAPTVNATVLEERTSGRPLLLLDLGIPEQVARDCLPREVDRAGLDELCATLQGRAARARANERADLLVERACQQFRVFCREPDFLEVLEAVHQCNRRMVGERIPGIVDDRFADLPEELRARLQLDLRGIFLSYMHEVYGSIKEAAQNPHLEAHPPELH